MINERLTEYSQGIHVDGDGAAILCDGVAITVDEVVERLTLLDEKCIKYRTALEWVKSGAIGFQTNRYRTDGLL